MFYLELISAIDNAELVNGIAVMHSISKEIFTRVATAERTNRKLIIKDLYDIGTHPTMTASPTFRSYSRLLAAGLVLFGLVGCSGLAGVNRDTFRPYVPEVVQGNFISKEQRQVLRQQFSQSAWTPEWGFQQRLKRQQDQLNALQAMSSEMTKPAMSIAQVETALQTLILQSIRPKDGTELSKQLQLEQQACQNLAQLHNTMTPAQRLKAQRKLKDYETDVRELMKL